MTNPVPTVLFFDSDLLTQLHVQGSIPLEPVLKSLPGAVYPNTYFVLQSSAGASALVRVSPDREDLLKIYSDQEGGIKPRNKEQAMLWSTLMDPRIQVQIVSGKAGTGKTMLALAAAMAQVGPGLPYEKIILTRPMTTVGKVGLGYLPGSVEEKIAPYLINYESNITQLIKQPKKHERGGNKQGRQQEEKVNGFSGAMLDFLNFYNVETVPIQLLRGASFSNAFIIADEIQVLDHHEMLTLGTRVGGNSKLVLMGDLAQRDTGILREKTGLHKIVNDPWMQASSLTACIELLRVERGPVAELFTRVFDEVA